MPSNSDFELLQLSDEALLAYEVFKFASPFATAGSFAVSVYSLVSNQGSDPVGDALNDIREAIDRLAGQLVASRDAVINKINDLELKKITSEVAGISEGLLDYRGVGSDGILDNLITETARLKRTTEQVMTDPQSSSAHLATYGGLFNANAGNRLVILGLYKSLIESRGSDNQSVLHRIEQEKEDAREAERYQRKAVEFLTQTRVRGPFTIDLGDDSGDIGFHLFRIGFHVDGNFQMVSNLGSSIRENEYREAKRATNEAIETKRSELMVEAWKPYGRFFMHCEMKMAWGGSARMRRHLSDCNC